VTDVLGVPAPPPGPGVVPPFAAPPRDRDHKRLWVGLGVGGAVVVLGCVAGVFGIRVLASGSEDIVRSQASSVVDTYLGALREQNYPDAYDQLCSDLTDRLTLRQFQASYGRPPVVSYHIDDVQIANQIVVNASVTRRGENETAHNYPLVQSGTVLKICGGL
jgi:hypothetical protein